MVKPNGSSRVVGPAAAAEDAGTRERILAAAHQVFLRRGTAAARTQEIADEAGVNKALLHYYFGTKAALADAVFQRAAADFLPRFLRPIADPSLPLADKVRLAVREHIDFHRAHPYLAGYVIAEANADPDRIRRLLPAGHRPPLAVLQAQLDAEAAAGRLRPIAVESFLVNLISLLVMPFALRPMLDIQLGLRGAAFEAMLDARRETLADFFLAGLRP